MAHDIISTQRNGNVAPIQAPAIHGLTLVNLNGGHSSQKLEKRYVCCFYVIDDLCTHTNMYFIWQEASQGIFRKMGPSDMMDIDVYALFPGKWLTD